LTQSHQLRIDSVGGLGDGIARLGDKPVFVPKSCAGDIVSVRITQDTKEFARGEIVEVIQPGDDRITAPCLHFSQCGGCSLQQLSDASYTAFKRKVLADALAHAGFGGHAAEVVFLTAATRRRVDFKVIHTNYGFSLAYHGLRSHNLTAIAQCPILEPALQALLAPLTKALSVLPFAQQISAVRLTRADSGIDMLLEFTTTSPHIAPLTQLAQKLGIARISVQSGKMTSIAYEGAPVTMKLGGYDIPLPVDGFLQAAESGQKTLTDFVIEHSKGAKHIVDLFCGIGTYSFPASRKTRVHAVELQGAAVEVLKAAVDTYKIRGHLSAQERDLFQKPLSAIELASYDCAIVNPPRAGARAQIEAITGSGLKKIVMISCNPASFARDARTLKNAGFALTHALGLDQFVWSPHLEIAAVFEKP